MKRISRIPNSLNPYSKCFFALWFLAAVISSIGFRTSDEPSYKEQIDQWHQKRVNSLKSENGWLNLIGLFWLKDGKNSIGQGPDFDVPFPTTDNKLAEFGLLNLEKDEVRFTPNPGASVSAEGKPITESLVVFSPDAKPTVLANGSLRWVIIKRGDKFGVRVRDLESASVKSFPGIDRFPVAENWRIKARLETPPTPQTIPIINVLGQTTDYPLVGTLVFEKDGKTYRLQAAGESEKLFIIFGDATNKIDTYGAGRFLYADKPGDDKIVTLDFNQAVNPPCAFTTFATCPLPPKQNRLTLAVTAGEKRYGEH
ncbi:DUF1684 domain-containing protein [Spirosoma harenae]